MVKIFKREKKIKEMKKEKKWKKKKRERKIKSKEKKGEKKRKRKVFVTHTGIEEWKICYKNFYLLFVLEGEIWMRHDKNCERLF